MAILGKRFFPTKRATVTQIGSGKFIDVEEQFSPFLLFGSSKYRAERPEYPHSFPFSQAGEDVGLMTVRAKSSLAHADGRGAKMRAI
jgi:hypothetical protein